MDTPRSRQATLLSRARDRHSTVLTPLGEGKPRGSFPLWELVQDELPANAPTLPATHVLAVTWSDGAHTLEAVNLVAWSPDPSQGRHPEPVDLSKLVSRDAHGPRAILEAVALVVHFDLAAVLHYAKPGKAPSARRVIGAKLGLGRQVLVVHDLDRSAARSFSLDRVTGVELMDAGAAPVWVESSYALEPRDQ